MKQSEPTPPNDVESLHPEPTDLERLGDEIAELSAQIQAATYRLLTLIREFDEGGGWNTGFRSCAHWLCWRTGLELGAAREKVRVARALGRLPRLGAAMGRGELSYSKVRALTRVATPETEEELLIFAKAGTAAHVEKLVRAWRRVDRSAELEEAERRHASRYLEVSTDEDGMVTLRARLEPEAGAAVCRALEAACDVLYEEVRDGLQEGGETGRPQRRADALVLVAESALSNGLDPGTRGDRYQVTVHVDAEVLADPDRAGVSVLEDGQNVSAETSRRLACEASRVTMTHGSDGTILDIGRRTRTIPPALRRALTHRDGGCRFPGCGVRFCEGHHVTHWANGGETSLENVVLLCRRHHRAVHEEGFQLKRLPDGELRFFSPQGRPISEAPEPTRLGANPIDGLIQRLLDDGVEIDERTGFPSWDGGPVDIACALDFFRDDSGIVAFGAAAVSQAVKAGEPSEANLGLACFDQGLADIRNVNRPPIRDSVY